MEAESLDSYSKEAKITKSLRISYNYDSTLSSAEAWGLCYKVTPLQVQVYQTKV